MPAGTAPASAIIGTGGDLLLDPTLPVVASGAASPIAGTIAVTRRRLLALRAAFAPWFVAAELYAESGDPFALLGGMPGPRAQTPFGELWLEPASLFVIASGVIDASEHRLVAFPVPRNPDLAGLLLGLVAARAVGSTGRAELSNPMVTVLF